MSDGILSQEELFVYYTTVLKKSKSDAYRAIVDCTGLSNELIASRAWKYANSASVIAVMGMQEDNLYARYHSARTQALDVLLELATSASSEKVRSDSANALLTQTAKIKGLKIDHEVTHKHELSIALDELRQIALTPHSVSPMGKKPSYNPNTNFEKFPESELKANAITIDGEVATKEHVEEQVNGLNPLTPNKGKMGNDSGTTGRFRDSSDGRFVSNEKAKEILDGE